jgi:UDP-N-acetylglucosamine--N-acetylmuramyl-(pentapeptide) pyrophosphoryl-undecaprenol N-acetylglucosamine transferase
LTFVLLSVSPIGFGHASRAVALAEELERRGADIVLVTGGYAAEQLSSYGLRVLDRIRAPAPVIRGGVMKDASLWYAKYWFAYRRSKQAMRSLTKELAPDVIVGDEEFSSVSTALEQGLGHALITDELELGFARSPLARAFEKRVAVWYTEIQEKVRALIIPEFGVDVGNRRFVTPIVRTVTATREEVEEEYSLPRGGLMVLFSMSGTGMGEYFMKKTIDAFRETRIPGAFLTLVGSRGERVTGEGIHDLGVVREGQNLVAAADLVISTAGKSTIDEAASAGTPIIPIPIKNHREQEENARALGFRPEDIHRLGALIRERIGLRSEPKHFQGTARTADILMKIAA